MIARFSAYVVTSCPANPDGPKGMPGTPTTAPSRTPRAEPGPFSLSSATFNNGGAIPERCAGAAGKSPQLSWSDAPQGTHAFVILMDDPDAEQVVGHTFVHWVARLPASYRALDEGASAGGWTDKRKPLAGDCTSTAYAGPRPPAGSGTHRYHIAVYAMSRSFADPNFRYLASSRTANDRRTYTRANFESLYRANILASAEIVGTYRVDAPAAH